MPIPSADTGWAGRRRSEQWYECDRCGFTWPFSLIRFQDGDGGTAIVCTVYCYDEPSRGDYLSKLRLPTEAPLDFVPGDG